MTASQIRIGGLNAASGVYSLRLNFNGSKHWDAELGTLGGTFFYVNWDYAIVSFDNVRSSRPTAELSSESGEMGFELNDAPNLEWLDDTLTQQFGPIFREHFEQARASGITVHVILGRYDDVTMPVTEFCFAGSMNPSNYSVAHRRVAPGERRSDTVKCTFSPAMRLNVPLSEIAWQESDMEGQREFIAGIVSEPETSSSTGISGVGFDSADVPNSIASALSYYDDWLSLVNPQNGLAFSCIQSYGTHMRTSAVVNPNPMGDFVGNLRTFPAGNWGVRMSTAVRKICESAGIAWDGNLNRSVTWPVAHWNDSSLAYDEVGETTDPLLSFNVAFGFNWWNGTAFKSPATWDASMFALDALRGIAIQLGCWCNFTDAFNSDGLPILAFMPIDFAGAAMPDLTDLPDSAEDAPISDKDGVSVKRRGFDGAIIAPANALNPVAIEVPFGTHAMGYGVSPAYDVSRLTLNVALEFKSQWKNGHRGAFTYDGAVDDGSGGRMPSLNPDGWVLGSLMFDYESNTANTRFPPGLDHVLGNPGGTLLGYHDDGESCYRTYGWAQYYAVHATYENAILTDDEKRDRQQHEMLAYAMLFGRAIRGQRKQLQKSFEMPAAWGSIALGQIHKFTPVLTELDYRLVSIERDIKGNEIHCQFEELVAVDNELITWRIDGKEGSGNGSIGGNAASSNGGINVAAWDVSRPAQLTTNTADWNAGQTGKTVVYVNSTAQITISGISRGSENSFIVLINNGTHPISLTNNDTASVSANRLIVPGVSGLKTLGPNAAQWLLYDATAQRWRLLPS